MKKINDILDWFKNEDGKFVLHRVLGVSIALITALSLLFLLVRWLLPFLVLAGLLWWVYKPEPQPTRTQYYWNPQITLREVLKNAMYTILQELESQLPIKVGELMDFAFDSVKYDGVDMYYCTIAYDGERMITEGGIKKLAKMTERNQEHIKATLNEVLFRRLQNWNVANCTPSFDSRHPLFALVDVKLESRKWKIYVLPITSEVASQYADIKKIGTISVDLNDMRWTTFTF